MYAEADLLPRSGLQHLAFCERQWGLIHIEQSWADNRLTAEGSLLHAKVDEPTYETRKGVRAVRGLPLRNLRLGLSGRADLVEFPVGGKTLAVPVPVEYKRGNPKNDDVDEIQLCAQAMCLEEMLGVVVPAGAFFYHQTRRRTAVDFTIQLRTRVENLASRMHQIYRTGVTPSARKEPKCRRCSMIDLCRPEWLSNGAADSGSGGDPWRRWQRLWRSETDRFADPGDPS